MANFTLIILLKFLIKSLKEVNFQLIVNGLLILTSLDQVLIYILLTILESMGLLTRH